MLAVVKPMLSESKNQHPLYVDLPALSILT